MEKKKNDNIEILRAFLILMIMFYHFVFRFGELFKIKTIDFFSLQFWGTIGVNCFFMLAGFFVYNEKKKNFKITKFLFKKVKRLWPMYFICLTLTFIIVNTVGLEGRMSSFLDYILNLFFINGFIGTKYVDGAYWYLNSLLIFYIIIAVVFYITAKYQKIREGNIKYLDIILLLFICIFRMLLFKFGSSFNKLIGIYDITGGHFFYSFVIGYCLSQYYNEKIYKSFLLYFLSFTNILLFQGIVTFIFTMVFSLIVIAAFNIKELKLRLLKKIGNISYPIYLIHQNIGYIILLRFYKITNNFRMIYVAITIIIMTLFSLIIGIVYKKLKGGFGNIWKRIKN